LARHILDRQDGLVELSPVGRFLRLSGLFNGTKLNECVIALHIDPDKFTKWLKEHLQVFLPGRFFVKVHYKECFRGLDLLPAFVFLLLDASIAASKFGTKCIRHIWNFPV